MRFSGIMSSRDKIPGCIRFGCIPALLLVAALISVVGYGYFLHHKQITLDEKRQELSVIAVLKADQIAQWRKTCLVDAQGVYSSRMFAHRVNDYLNGIEAVIALTEIRDWMASMHEVSGYGSIALYKPDGHLITSFPNDGKQAERQHLEMIAEAVQSRKIVFSDFHSGEKAGDVHLNIVVPVRYSVEETASCLAVVIFEIDPYISLYSQIQVWPTVSASAETMLVRQDGDEVVCLNELRHQKKSALTLRFPDSNGGLPAVKAASGTKGAVTAIDYRGVSVIAATNPVPGTPWSVVAKIDTAEISAPVAKRAWLVTLSVLVVAITGGFGFYLWWGRKKAVYLRREHEAQLKYNAGQANARNELQKKHSELAASYALNESLLRTIPFPIDIVDASGRLLFVSPTMEQAIGRQAIGEYCWELYKDDRQQCIDCPLKQPIQIGKTSSIESRAIFDGKIYEVFHTGMIYDGKEALMEVFLDITERKHAEEWLLKLFRAVENSPASVVITDKDGLIEYVNRKFTSISGYSAEEVIGQNPRVLNSGLQPKEFYQEMWVTILNGDEWRGEFCNRKKNNEVYWESASISPIRDDKGCITHFVAVKDDMTDRKRIAEELLTALDAAGAASRSKSEFIANMSHEIRTPLNAIIGFSSLALDTDISPRLHGYVSKINTAGVSLLGIINNILDFSKIEAGKTEMERLEFSLDSSLTGVISFVQQKAIEKSLVLYLTVAPDVPGQLIGDAMLLNQVLTNLLGNAIKFTEKGSVEIIVNVQSLGKNSVKLLFSVRDTGIGMTHEQSALLFQPFMQADNSMTRKFGGTGLGLSISRKLVELMGGEIWLESEPGEGSTFSFTSTFGLPDETTQRIIPEVLNGLRILVADDSPVVCMVLEALLSDLSVTVDTVSTGKAAVDAVRKQAAIDPYRVVMIDCCMPEMDGIEATSLIKSDMSIITKPIIIMISSFGSETKQDAADNAGVDKFLYKPFTASTLFNVLTTVLSPSELPRNRTGLIPSQPIYSGERGCILLVEDNETNQQLAMELLERKGFIVDVANNGREAVAMVTGGDKAYDMVLMDIQMPEMDGYEATRLIRRDKRFAALPIIAMTAHAMDEERQKTMDAGMNDHIAKPIDAPAMFATIDRFVQRQGVRGDINKQHHNASDETDIPEIAGLDVRTAMGRIDGDKGLYLSLLRSFVSNQSGAALAIEEALKQKNMETALRVVHTSKGIAGTIGSRAVVDAATALEKALGVTDHPESIKEKLAIFGQEIERLVTILNKIHPVRQDSAECTEKVTVDPKIVTTILIRLVRYVRQSDGKAEDYLSEHRAELAGLPREAMKQLTMSIARFDYDSALAILNSVATEAGIDLLSHENGEA